MEKKLTFLILTLCIFQIFSKHVKFSIQRQKDIYSDDDEELSMNILENNMFCDIEVGNQKVPFQISFDKELTFILDDNYIICDLLEDCLIEISKYNLYSFDKKGIEFFMKDKRT